MNLMTCFDCEACCRLEIENLAVVLCHVHQVWYLIGKSHILMLIKCVDVELQRSPTSELDRKNQYGTICRPSFG